MNKRCIRCIGFCFALLSTVVNLNICRYQDHIRCSCYWTKWKEKKERNALDKILKCERATIEPMDSNCYILTTEIPNMFSAARQALLSFSILFDIFGEHVSPIKLPSLVRLWWKKQTTILMGSHHISYRNKWVWRVCKMFCLVVFFRWILCCEWNALKIKNSI